MNFNYRQNNKSYLLGVLLILPFVQLGFSYYISFQVLAYILINIYLFKSRSFKRNDMIYFGYFFTFLGIYIAIAFTPGLNVYSSDVRDVLRVIRESLCVSTMLLVFFSTKKPGSEHIDLNSRFFIDKYVDRFIYLLCLAVGLQYIAASMNVYLLFPTEWFVVNKPIDISRIFQEFDIKSRVSLSYGEPSYFALVLAGFSAYAVSIKKYNLWLCCLVASLFTASTFGVLSVLLIYVVSYLETKVSRTLQIWIIFLLTLTAFVIVREFKDLIIEAKGASAFIRLYAPWYLVTDVFSNIPSGIPFTQIQNHISGSFYAHIIALDDHYVGFDNAMLNLFIIYGFFGVALIISLTYVFLFSKKSILYFLLFILYCFQNGSIFTFDKISLLSFFYILIGLPQNKAMNK